MVSDSANSQQPANGQKTPETGNASNPAPTSDANPPTEQLLSEKAEKYLREVASIEDLPDPQDQAEMDQTIANENGPDA